MDHETEQITEFVRFTRAATVWRYTSAETSLSAAIDGTGMQTWEAVGLSRSGYGQGPEEGRRPVHFGVPPDLPLVAEYRAVPQPQPVAVAIWRRLESEEWPETSLIWSGRVIQVMIADGSATIVCEPVLVSMKRLGLRRRVSRQCTHVLYGAQCRAAALSVTRTVASVDGSAVSLDAEIDARLYGGGYLERADGSRSMIAWADMRTVILIYPAAIRAGETVTLVAGCDHSLETCAARFDNAANFGGFPWVPEKNPFQASAY